MITRSSILNEIPTLINQVTQLTQSGIVKTLPFKLSYGLAKNAKEVRKFEDAAQEKRKEFEKLYCVMEFGKPKMTITKTEGQPDRTELTFADEDKKIAFQKAVGDYLSEEVKFDAFKIKMSDIEDVDNLTPSILSLMEKYGIIE